MGYVIDSNAVIDYLSGQLPKSAMPSMNGIVNDKPIPGRSSFQSSRVYNKFLFSFHQ